MNKSNLTPALLTVNAALLAALVLLQLNSGTVQTATASPSAGIPNAAGQRQQMIERLEALEASVKATQTAIESGDISVQVSNIGELRDRR